MRYCVYVYENIQCVRFNACFDHTPDGLNRALDEANWYSEHGYGVVILSRRDHVSRYEPPTLILRKGRLIIINEGLVTSDWKMRWTETDLFDETRS